MLKAVSSGGSGGSANNVTNAGSSTDDALARWDGTTGKILQDSAIVVADNGATALTSAQAQAFAVGPNGATNPVFNVAANTASQASGVTVTGNATGVAPVIQSTDSGANCGLTVSTKATGTLTLLATTGNVVANAGGTSLQLQIAGNSKFTATSNTVSFASGSSGNAANIPYSWTVSASTTSTAGTEAPHYSFGNASRTFSSNTAVTTQRFAIMAQPTAAFATSGGVITNAATFAIAGPVIVGANATITNNYALWTQSGEVLLQGGLKHERTVEANTAGSGAPNVLTTDEVNKVFTNEGATAENYHTLPTAVTGLTYTFVCQDTDGIRVTAAAGDTIKLGTATVSAAAGFVKSVVAGSAITLVAINATEWMAVSLVGTWTVDA